MIECYAIGFTFTPLKWRLKVAVVDDPMMTAFYVQVGPLHVTVTVPSGGENT